MKFLLRFSFLLLSVTAGAQVQTDALAGTVLSTWEAAVPDATITLTNRQAGTKATATTSDAGEYHFPTLAPGTYDLSVMANGFQPYSRRGITVEAGSHRDIRLQPGKEDAAASIKQLEAAMVTKPDDYVARFNLGRAYFLNGEMEKAAEQFVLAFKSHSDYLPTLVGLTQVALRTGDLTRALQFSQLMIRVNPKSSMAEMLEALCFLRMGRFDDSRQALTGILAKDPDDVDVLLELGALEMAQKQYHYAEMPYRRAYGIDPSNLRGLEGLAEAQVRMKEPEKAVQLVASEIEKDPQRRELRKVLAAVEALTGHYDKAIKGFQSIVDQYQDSPIEQADVYARMGDAYGNTDDLQRAVESLKKATQLSPGNASYLANLAQMYDRSGKKQDAVATYKIALKLQPNPLLMNNLAFEMADSGGDLDEALHLAQQARRELPEFNEILDTIGWIYLKKGLVDSAARIFEELVEKYSANWTYHYHYGLALAQKGDKAAALKELTIALEKKPGKAEEKVILEMVRKLS